MNLQDHLQLMLSGSLSLKDLEGKLQAGMRYHRRMWRYYYTTRGAAAVTCLLLARQAGVAHWGALRDCLTFGALGVAVLWITCGHALSAPPKPCGGFLQRMKHLHRRQLPELAARLAGGEPQALLLPEGDKGYVLVPELSVQLLPLGGRVHTCQDPLPLDEQVVGHLVALALNPPPWLDGREREAVQHAFGRRETS
jgi:hypothetical protein